MNRTDTFPGLASSSATRQHINFAACPRAATHERQGSAQNGPPADWPAGFQPHAGMSTSHRGRLVYSFIYERPSTRLKLTACLTGLRQPSTGAAPPQICESPARSIGSRQEVLRKTMNLKVTSPAQSRILSPASLTWKRTECF